MSPRAATPSSCALLLAVALTGCALHPTTGAPLLVALDTRQEIELGREAFVELQRTHEVLEDDPAAVLLAGVGHALTWVIPGRDFPYRFHLLDSSEANALALPGGIVAVTRGLLALCNDTDELAGILSHEIAHVTARHASRQMVWSRPASAIDRVLTGMFGWIGGGFGAGGLVTRLIAPYAQAQEREADRIGVALAASAGFDPAALGRVLARLERVRGVLSGGPLALRTHPPTAARIALIEGLAAQMQRGRRRVAEELLAVLDGLPVGVQPNHGTVRGQSVLVPSLGAAVKLPPGWIASADPLGISAVGRRGEGALTVRPQGAARAREDIESMRREEARLSSDEITVAGARVLRVVLRYAESAVVMRAQWITWSGGALRVAGTWSAADDEAQSANLSAVVASIRALSPEERAEITAPRLRLVAAEPGESWEALVRRAESAWSVEQVAAINGLSIDVPPPAGQRLKVPRDEPWRSRALEPAE